jgi:hypothetical protein
VLREISIAQTQITEPHQKPLSDIYNSFQMMERRYAACYAPVPVIESPNKPLQAEPAGGALIVRFPKRQEMR